MPNTEQTLKTDSTTQTVRRKFPRREFARSIGVMMDGHYQIHPGVEMGEGGLSFQSDVELPENKHIVVSFQVPGGSFVSTIATVRTSLKNAADDHFIVGCAFANILFDYKREIRTFVSAR